MTNYTDAFIREMPKSDLHLHLDGSLRIPSLIEMAKRSKFDLHSACAGTSGSTLATALRRAQPLEEVVDLPANTGRDFAEIEVSAGTPKGEPAAEVSSLEELKDVAGVR